MAVVRTGGSIVPSSSMVRARRTLLRQALRTIVFQRTREEIPEVRDI